jgi:hypothetical protein
VGPGLLKERAWETRKVCNHTNVNAWDMSAKVQKRISETPFPALIAGDLCFAAYVTGPLGVDSK